MRGRPRRKGERTKKIAARLSRMRNMIAMGLSDHEIREKLTAEAGGKFSEKQWHHLRQAFLQDAKGESNLTFWSRFRERHEMRYRECVRLLSYAHGVDNPRRKVDAQGRFVDPADQFLVPPDVSACVQVLRLMKDLDECKLEIGLRLSVFNREPTRLLVGRMPEELDDNELATLLDETVRRAAAALGCPESQVLQLVEHGTIEVEATVVADATDPAGKGNGHGGNGNGHGGGWGGVPPAGTE